MDGFQQNIGVIYDWALFRRDVRRDVRNCVLFLLLFFGVNLLVSFIVEMAALMSNPMMREIFWDSERWSEAGANLPESALALSAILGIAAGGCVFWIWRKGLFFGELVRPAAERMTPKIFFVLVVLTQGFQCVYGLITALVDALLPGGLSIRENYAEAMDALYTPLGFLYIALIGPVFEELVFRGAILGALRRFGDNFAILFSALMFGFYHMLILQIPFAFVLGLLLGYTAARWSLRASIALHIVVNGLSTLVTAIGNSSDAVALYGFVLFACAILTLIFAIVWRRQFWARVRWSAAYYPHTYANGFSSVAFWIFIAGTTAFGLLTF